LPAGVRENLRPPRRCGRPDRSAGRCLDVTARRRSRHRTMCSFRGGCAPLFPATGVPSRGFFMILAGVRRGDEESACPVGDPGLAKGSSSPYWKALSACRLPLAGRWPCPPMAGVSSPMPAPDSSVALVEPSGGGRAWLREAGRSAYRGRRADGEPFDSVAILEHLADVK
jgi:hypothetical protein